MLVDKRRALTRRGLTDEGSMEFRYGVYLWDPRYKGLDDYLWDFC